MSIKYLDSKNYLFGNKGAVWSNEIHIHKTGNSGSRCGVPGLSSNWAAIWEKEEAGCPTCIVSFLDDKHEEYCAEFDMVVTENFPGDFPQWLKNNSALTPSQIDNLFKVYRDAS
jgi:hypothetical protein